MGYPTVERSNAFPLCLKQFLLPVRAQSVGASDLGADLEAASNGAHDPFTVDASCSARHSLESFRTISFSDLGLNDPRFDALLAARDSAISRSRRRLPALVATLCIELGVAFVITKYTETLTDYPLLIAFMPVISAISGNLGLQSSSITARALALGLARVSDWRAAVAHELKAGFCLSLMMGFVVFCCSSVFPDASASQRTPDPFFGAVVGACMFFSSMLASISGAVAPLLFARCGLDPTALAGPLETAFQDVVGNVIFLSGSSFLLSFDRGLRLKHA